MRTAIEADLQAREWRWGYSGEQTWHWEALRFIAPNQLVHTTGSDVVVGEMSHGPINTDTGTYRVTESGAVEQTLSNSTRRSTYVQPGSPNGLWAWGFVRSPSAASHYWREEFVQNQEDRRELVVELELGEAVTSRAPGTPCSAHLRAEGLITTKQATSERAGLDLELKCVVERRGPLVLLVFADLKLPTQAHNARTDWSNWLALSGHDRSTSTAMRDLMIAAFQSVLVWDPASADVLRELRDEDLSGTSR